MSLAQATFDGFPVAVEQEKSGVAEYLELSEKHGGLIPQQMLAEALGVSKQRVGQFIAEKRFNVYRIGGINFMSGNDLYDFLQVERQNGRPPKEPSMKAMVKSAATFVKAEAKRRKKEKS